MIDVGSVDDLKHGVPAVVRLEGREVALVRWGDEVFAVRNVCPHQSESFFTGFARRDYVIDRVGGEIALGPEDQPVLICPVHNWKYRLRDGQCGVDERLRVRTYAVTVTDGRVLVDVDAKGGTGS
jgi:nitrite reductase/ring-hydroxylating ferredoxin subunit